MKLIIYQKISMDCKSWKKTFEIPFGHAIVIYCFYPNAV